MFNIHDITKLDRVLPEHLESILSEKNQALNRFPPDQLMKVFDAGESKLMVDRGLALMAARSGVSVSSLATMSAVLMPVLIVSAIPLMIFLSWQAGALAVLGGIASFRVSRHFTKADVGRAALSNPKLLNALMKKGVVWFELK